MVLSLSLSYAFTGNIDIAVNYTIWYAIISTFLYYKHELFFKWLKKRKKNENQIQKTTP